MTMMRETVHDKEKICSVDLTLLRRIVALYLAKMHFHRDSIP